MTTFHAIGVAVGLNVAIVAAFLILYSIFSKQPINARVYFTKWFVIDKKMAERDLEKLGEGGEANRASRAKLNLNLASYLGAGNWLLEALLMPQTEFIQHAGLDALVFLKLFQLGLQIFVPIGILGFVVLVPLNVTDNYLSVNSDEGSYGEVDNFTISNITNNSNRLWGHVVMAYLFTYWACRNLWFEYKEIARLRLDFLADLKKQPDQFSVLVRQVPQHEFESIERHVDHFFHVNHPDYYLSNQVVYNANSLSKLESQKNRLLNKLTAIHISIEKHPLKPKPTHKTGFLGCCGARVDSVEFYEHQLEELNKAIDTERHRLLGDTTAIMPASFVTFRKRWGAAVCAQTQQSRDSSAWITEWAPEPRDVYWANLAIPYLQLTGRRITSMVALGGFIIFFVIPVTFVQSLANLESLEKKLPFLKPVINLDFINSVLQAFLPGLALKICLALVPHVCVIMSKVEGLISYSSIERKSMGKYYLILLVNVFVASVITGTIAQQVKSFIQRPTDIPTQFGNAIPGKAVFFISLVMVDGWAAITGELFRLFPLILFHFQGLLLVRTPSDREKAMSVQGMFYTQNIPQCLFYFLIGFVYCCITPLMVPFIVIFFFIGYVVYRNQLINVYHAEYESAAAFWPSVHGRIITGMLIFHVILIGLLIVKKAALAGPFLIPLPILTYVWHVVFCKIPFERAFRVYALEEAMKKDIIDSSHEDVDYDARLFLHQAYLHPAVKRALAAETDEEAALWQKKTGMEGPKLVALSRYPKGSRPQSVVEGEGAFSEGGSVQISRSSSISGITSTKPLLGSNSGRVE